MMDEAKFFERLHILALKTPDGIAEALRDMGIRGMPYGAEYCPIAVWTRHVTGAQYSSVSPNDIAYGPANPTTWVDHRVTVDLPEPVRTFVHRFDHGGYPDLEDC